MATNTIYSDLVDCGAGTVKMSMQSMTNWCPETRARRSAQVEVRGRVLSGNEPDQIQVVVTMRGETASVHWLIDTGAEKSFSARATYEKHLQEMVSLNPAEVRMFAINGSSVPVHGKCELEVALDGHNYPHHFIVADIDEEALLGYDLQHRYQCS